MIENGTRMLCDNINLSLSVFFAAVIVVNLF